VRIRGTTHDLYTPIGADGDHCRSLGDETQTTKWYTDLNQPVCDLTDCALASARIFAWPCDSDHVSDPQAYSVARQTPEFQINFV